VDEDGLAELVIQDARGTIHCIDSLSANVNDKPKQAGPRPHLDRRRGFAGALRRFAQDSPEQAAGIAVEG
jgi:hypothetical protein